MKNDEEWYKESIDKFGEKLAGNGNKFSLVGDYGVGKTRFIGNVTFKYNKYVKYINASSIIQNPEYIDNKLKSELGFRKNKKESDGEVILSNSNRIMKFNSFLTRMIKFILQFYFPVAIAIFSVVLPILLNYSSDEKKSLFLLILLLPIFFPIIIKFLITILFNRGFYIRKNKKVIVIDNLDRVSFKAFEKIIEKASSIDNIDVVVIFDLRNISIRYKEHFGFENENLFHDIEKYTNFIFDLESQISDEHEFIFKKIPQDYGYKFDKFIKFLRDNDINNFRILNRAIDNILNYIEIIIITKIDLEVIIFIQLLMNINYVNCELLKNDSNFNIWNSNPFYGSSVGSNNSRRSEGIDNIFRESKVEYNSLFKKIVINFLEYSKWKRYEAEIMSDEKKIIFSPSGFSDMNNIKSEMNSTQVSELLSLYSRSNRVTKRIIMNTLKDRDELSINLLKYKNEYIFIFDLMSNIDKKNVEDIFSSLSLFEKTNFFFNYFSYADDKFFLEKFRNLKIYDLKKELDEIIKNKNLDAEYGILVKKLLWMYEILKVEFSKKENNSHIKELMSYDKHKNYYIYRIINFLYTDNIKKIIKEKSFDIRLFSIDNGYSDNTKLKIEYKIDINKLKIISDILMINFKDIINSDCTEFVNFYIGNLNIDHKQVEKIKKNGYGEVENIVKIQKNNN